MNVGKVYFVAAPGRIKIGYTRNPERRLAQLRAADMEKIEPIGVIPGTRAIEAKLHAMLQPYRLRGEWFFDCADVRAVVNEALAGEISLLVERDLDEDRPASSNDSEGYHSDIHIKSVRNAIAEVRRIGDQMQERVRRRESIADLVDAAEFLSRAIIVPALGAVDRA